MNTVEPIRDNKVIRNIAAYLKKENERNYIMFLMGIYTGLRISDILKLKVVDVKNKKGLYQRDNKTKKMNTLEFNPKLKKALKDFVKDKEPMEYLIKSRKGLNLAITPGHAYKILREVAEMFGIEHIGTHSMRKTMGYHLYKQTKDVVKVQEVLNHSKADPSVTLRYIGVTREEVNKAIRELEY